MIRRFRIWKAQRRLPQLTKRRRESFEVQDFIKRRKAALKWDAPTSFWR